MISHSDPCEELVYAKVDLAMLDERSKNMEKRVDGLDTKFWWLITFQASTLMGVVLMLAKQFLP